MYLNLTVLALFKRSPWTKILCLLCTPITLSMQVPALDNGAIAPKRASESFQNSEDLLDSSGQLRLCTHTHPLPQQCILLVSQKNKDHCSTLMHIYGIQKDGNDNPICKTEKETQMLSRYEGQLRNVNWAWQENTDASGS